MLTRRTPLKRSQTPLRRSPVRRQSSKQRQKQAEWARLKREGIAGQIDTFGWAGCEDCPKRFYTDEEAGFWLQAHHRTHRSQCGRNELANLSLLCADCHKARHGIKVIREWRIMPEDEGGFDDELGEAERLEGEGE